MNIKENERLNTLNHSCAHLLAHALHHLYDGAKFWVGPVIDSGFYYDVDLGDKVLTEEDKCLQESWLVLSDVVLRTNLFILNILGIDVPERM